MKSNINNFNPAKPPKFLWANLCPRKLYWELGQARGKQFIKEWYHYPKVLAASFNLLHEAGITGIRLNIFNFELTSWPKSVNWQPLELVLNLAEKHKLQVHLCLGPWQYPLWPGLRLPSYLKSPDSEKFFWLDDDPEIFAWGNWWLEAQLDRYGNDPRIAGFYLGNEWPNAQSLESQPEKYWKISPAYMSQALAICHTYTDKPIIMNTNLDASQTGDIWQTYQNLWQFFPDQFRLALDVYPSRETWLLAPKLRLQRQLSNWPAAVKSLQSDLPVKLMAGEFEAQPWGAGESWAQWWHNFGGNWAFSASTLNQWFTKYLLGAPINVITLWGAEFWLTGYLLGYSWPLQLIRQWSHRLGQTK